MNIQSLCNDIAKKHTEIIENEIKKVLERFNCSPDDLIIEYHVHNEIKINVKGTHFKIDNVFYVNK